MWIVFKPIKRMSAFNTFDQVSFLLVGHVIFSRLLPYHEPVSNIMGCSLAFIDVMRK